MKRLTETEKKLILDFVSNKITEDELFSKYPSAKISKSSYIYDLLNDVQVTKSGEDLEYIFYLASGNREFKKEDVQILSNLITERWHKEHETIANYLQRFKDESCIDNVTKAMHMRLDYWYDDGDAFIRKCAYILGDIGSDYAIKKLIENSKSNNEIIKKYCSYQLSKNNSVL